VAYVSGGQVGTRRVGTSGTTLEAPVFFGTGVVTHAAAGSALVRLERTATNDTLVLRRLDSGKAEIAVATLPVSSISVLALARVGDSTTWLVTWRQQTAGLFEAVAASATWTADGWQLGPVTTVGAPVGAGPVAAGDEALPAVAYISEQNLYVRPLCP